MKLLLAKPRGYCAGVVMAIECLNRALTVYGHPVYVFHQIVHNKFLIESYRRQGVVFVDDLVDVPKGATLIYSAHGVAPAVRQEALKRKLRVIDATCPLVMKVHAEARRFIDNGYATFFIGHRDHDETVGVMGEAPGKIRLLESVTDAAKLDSSDVTRAAYLTQTTLSVNEAEQIIQVLKNKFSNLEGPRRSDICYATQNRQEAIRALAGESDMVLVVGSQNSSNSLRLVEVARAMKMPAYLIDGPEEISLEWFEGVSSVLLTAGASVPEELVNESIQWLRKHFDIAVEEREFIEESMRFNLPAELRFPKENAVLS